MFHKNWSVNNRPNNLVLNDKFVYCNFQNAAIKRKLFKLISHFNIMFQFNFFTWWIKHVIIRIKFKTLKNTTNYLLI